jgi:hypothetical protein
MRVAWAGEQKGRICLFRCSGDNRITREKAKRAVQACTEKVGKVHAGSARAEHKCTD